jgi:hypothetical protein
METPSPVTWYNFTKNILTDPAFGGIFLYLDAIDIIGISYL